MTKIGMSDFELLNKGKCPYCDCAFVPENNPVEHYSKLSMIADSSVQVVTLRFGITIRDNC